MAKPTWLTITPTSGNGNGTIRYSATEHTGRVQRTYDSIISNSKTEDCTVAVKQAAKASAGATDFLDIQETAAPSKEGGQLVITGSSNAKAITFSFKSGGTVTIPLPATYQANSEDTANGAAIAGDPGASDSYSFSITLQVPANTTVEALTATLVATTDGNATDQCVITQAAGDPYLWVGAENQTTITVNIPQDGTEQSVSVLSNDAWTVE